MDIEYRDPRPLAEAAILSTWIWLGFQALYGASSAFAFALMVMPDDVRITFVSATSDWRLAIVALISALPFVVSGTLILKWIYRTNANAQAYSTGMKVSPGWNVGFFFIPIANLWKPFHGVRESWEVSNMHDQTVPGWVRWWWGCWLGVNLIFFVSFGIGRQAETVKTFSVVTFLNTAGAIVSVPLALLLIRLIRTLTAAQESMHREESFV